MKTKSTFTNWDFDAASGVWAIDASGVINNGYPYFTWQIAPVIQAKYILFSDALDAQVTISWTNGDATRRIVFMKETSSGSATPVMGKTYTASTTFGSGTQIGSTGWYCVYKGTGSDVTVTGLTPSINYTVQVFEYNGSNGAERYLMSAATNNPNTFANSSSGLAFISTVTVDNISNSTADCGGIFSYAGGSAITAKGVCWSLSENPTTADSYTNDGTGLDNFTSIITNLAEGTTYYVRAYAINSYGTAYGENVTFKSRSTVPGAALYFDGSNDYVSVPDADELDLLDNFTVELWVKPELLNYFLLITKATNVYGTDGFSIVRSTSNGGYLVLENQINHGDLSVNKWNHIAAVKNNGTRHLYVNGVEFNFDGVSRFYEPENNSSAFKIGGDNLNGGYFQGWIDEIRVWNKVLTLQQIRENMYKTLETTNDNLIGYWQFNEDSGSNTLIDGTNKHHGSLINMDANTCWVSSTVPVGSGTSNSISAFSSGTASLGNVTITTTNDFDNEVRFVNTEINHLPNTDLPSGITLKGSRYFVIKCYGTPGNFSVDLRFTLGPSILDARADTYPDGVKLYRRDSNGDGDWTFVTSASSANSVTGEVTFTGILSFSQFAIGEDESALPVELTSFKAAAENNKVILNWQTATEVNNYGFSIERSQKLEDRSQNNWIEIGFVEGCGNSNSSKQYSFVDESVPGGKYSYRLKQIDTDGSFSYSKEITVEIHRGESLPTDFVLYQNYPNPFNPVTVINYQLPVSSNVQLKLFDITGKEIATLINEVKEAGYYNYNLDASELELTSGIYFYKLQTGEFSEVKKLVLLR